MQADMKVIAPGHDYDQTVPQMNHLRIKLLIVEEST